MFGLKNVFKQKHPTILERIVECIDSADKKSLSTLPARYINGKELVIDYRPHENHYQTISIRDMTNDYILVRNWKISNNKKEITIVSNSLIELEDDKKIINFVKMIIGNFEKRRKK